MFTVAENILSSKDSVQFSPLLMMFQDYIDNKEEYERNDIHGYNTYQEAIELIKSNENKTFRDARLERLNSASPNINKYFRKKVVSAIEEIDRLSANYELLAKKLVDASSGDAESMLQDNELYYNIPAKGIRHLNPTYQVYSHLEMQKSSQDIIHLFIYNTDVT